VWAERLVPPSSPPAGAGVQVLLFSHTGERLYDLSPAAPGLQLPEIEAQPWLPNPGFLCRTQHRALPLGVLKLCVKKLRKPDGFCF